MGAVWLTSKSLQDVLQILELARTKYLNEVLAAFEFMDHDVLKLVGMTHGASVKPPVAIMDDVPLYSILVETHGSNQDHDEEKLQAFVENIMDKGLVVDGAIAQSLGQVQDFWKVREACNPAVAATGYVYKYDVSLAADDFDGFIREMRSRLMSLPQQGLLCVNWGHIIDGNLHCNIVCQGKFERDPELLMYIERSVLEGVMTRNGSISAEHGLGQYKNKHMTKIKDAATLQAMWSVKKLFDPHLIMNPGKYLPSD